WRRIREGAGGGGGGVEVCVAGYVGRRPPHACTYTSRILSGSYTHALYGTDQALTDEVDVAALTPRLVRIEEPGDTYTLHHSMIYDWACGSSGRFLRERRRIPFTRVIFVRTPGLLCTVA